MTDKEQIQNRPELPWDDSFGDHIRILDNVLDDDICDACINQFDDLEQRGLCHTRKDTGSDFHQRSDTAIYWTEMDPMIHRPLQDIGNWVQNDVIDSCKRHALAKDIIIGILKEALLNTTEHLYLHGWFI